MPTTHVQHSHDLRHATTQARLRMVEQIMQVWGCGHPTPRQYRQHLEALDYKELEQMYHQLFGELE